MALRKVTLKDKAVGIVLFGVILIQHSCHLNTTKDEVKCILPQYHYHNVISKCPGHTDLVPGQCLRNPCGEEMSSKVGIACSSRACRRRT